MNFKRVILISLILCFLSVACVSASETQTSMESSDFNDLNAIDVADDDINEYDNGMYDVTGKRGSDGQVAVLENVLSSSNVDDKNATLDVADNGMGAGGNTSDGQNCVSGDVLSSSNSDDMLSASNEGTRNDLNNLILVARPGSTITLDRDYKFYDGVDPITITKDIVIDGKGHSIYLNHYMAFKLDNKNPTGKIQIKNITFLCGTYGAISGSNCCQVIISNCRFINNSGDFSGPISLMTKYDSQIINCTFKRCFATGSSKVTKWETIAQIDSTGFSAGGAISISGPVTVKSCRFEECSAGDGGAITAYGNCKIIDSVFVKNYAGRADAPQSYDNGGAIRLNYGSGALIKGCTFTENYARFGGAISSMANNVRIEDCVFNSNYMNNKLRQEGGAIFVSYDSHIGDTSIVITRCAFNNNGYNNNNHYCKYGGAIYFHDGIASGTVSYCNFTGNGASKEGGAVYASSNCKSLTFTGCLFTKNKVDKYGGAIYLDSKSSNIVDCAFIEQPNAIYCDNKGCNVRFCTFLRNDNYDVWSTKEINIEKNWFGNTMDTRGYDFSKLKGKAVNLKNYENLYLVATFMDKNYYNGLESTVILNFRYMRDAPTSDNNLPPFNNPAISYGVTGQNAIVVSKNLYLANGKSSFKFVADATIGSSSLTVDCYGAKITLKFKTNPYSFNALQVLVDNCQNGVLNLDHGYARDKSIDGDMTVSISKNLVINGNGFTVDSKNLGGVFNIAKSVNVEINNLNIVNCYSNFGAAIEGYANRIVVNNCGFINCSAKSDGGAIKLIGKRITITNSTFINNTAGGKGGSLWLSGISTVKDCIFINSNAGYYGSFIFLDVHTRLDLSNSILLTYSTTKYIDKPSGPESQVNVMVNIENNWFGGTNDDILRNYEMLNNFAVKSLLYLNVMPSVYDIPVGNSSNISLKFYAYDLNSRRSVPLTSFRNMKFGVKLLNEGGTLSSDSIILINNEGSVVYTSSSDGEIPIEIDYELFAHRIYLNQFDDGSFTDLKYLISNSGDVINLTSDYTFSLMSDYMLTDGIYINNDLTINGNGHVIDGDGQARIFNIDGHKVVLNNITFINGKADNGGAICTSTQTSLYIDSCRFENNSARNGGAIYLESYKDVNIDASVFNSNSAEKEGGAIYYSGDYRRKIFSNITGNFTNNRAEDGGAIYLIDVGQYRLKGNFISNSARNMGGAVYSHGAIGIPFFFIDGIFDSNSAAFGGAVYSFSPFGNFNGIYQNNRASKDGGAIYMLGSSSKYGRPSNISGEFYSNTAGDQGSAVCALNIGDKNVDVYDSIFMKNNGKSTIYSSGKYYLDVRNSIFVDNVNINVLDASQEEVVGGLRAYNNWFGNTVDNLDKGPSVGRRVILNDWLFLDVDYGKTETYMGSLNSITFTLKSYDAKKGTVSEYTGDFKLNLSLKSDNGDFSTDSFILHDIPFEVTFVPEEYGESKVVVLANLSKYSHKVYEIKYNVVDHPSDSFYVLQYEIDNMNGTVLNLSGNYEFYPEIDALDGIKINKSITINGNGFVIDGKGESRIFNILADDVVLENISLINGNDINGSAIYATGRNITIRNSVLLNNFDVVIYATNPLNANYNWWGNTADTFNGKANVSSNVILDNALFATFNANSTIISAGKNTTLTLNLTNLYNFNLETNSTYGGLNLFAFIFNADGGNINVTSDDLHDGMIYVSFEAMGPYYGEIFAIFESVVLKHEFEVIYDEDSLTALYYLINKTGSGGVVNLTHDYKFYYYDVDYISGIPIDKTVTINGNGFDIDAMNESSIFVVSADNVSLTNINIYNSFNAVEWLGNNGVISNVSVNNSYCALNCFGSNVVVRNSNFTRANRYSVYLEGSNHVVDNCRFVDNSGLSIIGIEVNNLTIENSLFENIYSPISGIIEIDGCNGVNITGCIFNNQNNKSISIVGGSTVYLNKNNLSISDYIFNDGTILSKTFACLDDVNSSYMVGDVILLNATIYDDNNNIILLDEFYFKIDDELYLADFYIDAYEYLWVLTNGSWLVLPEISEKSFENCTVDSLIVNVLKYNSSVVITSIADVVYGEDVNIGFKFENSTAVRITVTLNSEMVFNETTDEHDISIPDLKAGLYNVIIRTLETEYYQSSSVTSAFRVTRAGSSLTLMDVVDAYYGKDIIINFTVENRTNVIASIYDIDTREFVFNDAVEGDFLIISNLSVGSYSITLTNIIDQNYNPSGDYAVFNVLKVNSSIIFDNKTEYVYGNVLINYVVDNLTEVMVTVVDLESGERDNFTTTNSTISLDLDAGFYQVELVNVETENVFASQDFKTLFVIPANSSVEIDGIGDVYYGDNIEISFVVMNATNVTVVVKNEDGAVIYQNNTDESYVDLSDLAAGKYAVEVYNSGSINFNPSSDTKTFYVLKAASLIEFDYSNVIYYGLPFRLDYDVENETVLNICIYDFEGNIIYDKNFNEIPELPDEATNLTEDAYLGFYFFIYRNLTVGNYTFEFTNLGNSNISGDRVNGSFEIIKAPSYVEVLVDSIYCGDDLEVQIAVVNATVVNVMIEDDVDGGIVYNENVTESPVIVSNLPAGRYTVIVTNYGTENIIGNSSSQEFNVFKFNSTVTLNNISDIYYEDAVLIEFDVENKTVVNVMIQNQDGEVIYDENVTSGMLSIPYLDVGNYTVTVTNMETFNVSRSSDSKSFKVLKRSINITVVAEDNVYGELSVIHVISDIDGLLPVNVGNQQLFVGVVDGHGKVMISLDAGNYTAYVNYTDDNYDINMTNSSFVVTKANIALSIEVLDKVYTADVTGNVFASVDGEYKVIIGNYAVPVIVKDGIGSFNAGILTAGNYSASVIFNGTNNYDSADNVTAFKVTQSGTNFNVVVNETNITYGGVINVTQSLPGDAAGNITYRFANGTIIDVIGVNGSFVLSGLDAGSYVVYAEYSGDSNYASAMDSLTIVVNKAVNDVVVYVSDVVYGENATIIVRADVDGRYAISVGGRKVIVDVVDGIGVADIALDAGSYSTAVEFVDANYDNNVTDCEFDVSKADISLSIEVLDKVYTADVDGNVFASVDGEYMVVIGSYAVYVVVEDGVGSFNVGILNVGDYTAFVIFNGTGNYDSADNKTAFKVTQSGTNFNIVVNETNITYGGVVNVTQSLPGDAAGNITYRFANGTIIDVIGVNESFVLSGLDAGSYVVYAEYSGDSNYASAKDSLTIVVNKAVNNVVVYACDVVYGENATITVSADVDGRYTIIVGGKKVIVDVLNGIGKAIIALDAGSYSTAVEFADANYDNNVTDCEFTVTKANITLSITVLDKVYTADVTGNVFASVDGEYKVIIGNCAVPVVVEDGVGSFNVGILDAGNYSAYVIFNGTGNYNSADNVTAFKVTQSGTNFNIVVNATNVTYGDVINVTQRLPDDAEGNITYRFANGSVIKVLNVGESFVLSGLDAGSYVIYADYSGDSKYASAKDSLTITVKKAINKVVVYAYDVVYGENATITVSADVDGQYIINLGDRDVIVDVLDGIGVVDIALDAGSYSTAVEFVDANYDNNVSDCEFAVTKANITLSITVLDKVYTADVMGNVFASVDGEYKVIIGNYAVPVVVEDGVGSFNVGILDVGNFTAFVIFNGTGNYNYANNKTAFKVTPSGTNFNVIANATEISYGGVINVTQSLPADATGNITYRFANGSVIKVLNVGESFVLSGLDAGSYVIYADYSGDSKYASAKDSVTIVVSKADVSLSIEVLDKVYTADVDGNVFASVDGEYRVMIGNFVTRVIVKNGVGSFDVGIMGAGIYEASVIFEGDDNYNYAVNNTSFEVTQTGTNFNIIANATEINYGDLINITQSLPGDATGNVTYTFANGTLIKVVGNNESFVLSGLNAGSYVIYANYSGDGSYASAIDSVTITVNKLINNVVVSVDDVTYPDNVTVNVRADVDGTYLITVAGTALEVSVANGVGNWTMLLPVGNYTTVTKIDLPNYNNVIKEAAFSVLPVVDYNLTIETVDKTIVFNGPADATGNVTVTIGNKTYVASLVNGSANITVPELVNGANEVTISYSGDDKYAPRSYSTNVTIETKIIASNMIRGYNSGLDYQIKVVDVNGNPIANKIVKIRIRGKIYNVRTDANGIAKLNAKLPAGAYTVAIINPDTGKTTLKTLKIIKRFIGNRNVVTYYNSNYKYRFKVIGDNGKAVGKGIRVNVKIGKKTFRLRTDAKGFITIVLNKNFVPNKYILRAAARGYSIKNVIYVKQVILSSRVVVVKKSASNFVLTAKLKQGKVVLKNKVVVFKFGGKTYKAKTNKFGVAKLTFSKNVINRLKVGNNYLFTITYLKDTVKRVIKVRR